MSSLIGDTLQSGLWFKDEGSFINVREARRADVLQGVRIYEFDSVYRLRQMTAAQRAEFRGRGRWELTDVVQTRFAPEGPRTERMPKSEWRSAVNPDLLDALLVKPERMSAWALHRYTQHLAGNRQENRGVRDCAVEEAALPARHAGDDRARAALRLYAGAPGMVGVKVFFGIMLGIFFHMLNSLFPTSACCRTGRPSPRRGAFGRVPRLGDAHDVVGRAALAPIFFLSCPVAIAKLASATT